MKDEQTTEQKLNKIEERIRTKNFRENKGLGSETGYYIFGYDPKDELIVRERVKSLERKYSGGGEGFTIKVFDLYDIMIDILKEKGYLEKSFEMEKKHGIEKVTESIGRTLRITSADDLTVNYIMNNTPPDSVVFIVGVGKCYPVLRSHTALNNLSLENPVVMFYPGRYNGQELYLFEDIKDDNYYRAFDILS